MNRKSLSWFMMMLVVVGGFAPFATAQFTNPASAGFTGGSYGGITNTYQSSRPTLDSFYGGSFDTYWPILNNLQEDQCDAVNSDFIIGIPPGGCSPMVVRSDLLAEQNVPVFCQLSAIRVNPLIDVSTIKSISFKGDYPDEVAGISFHPARAAVKSYRTLLGDPIDENIGYVVIVLKQQPDERNLEEYVSGMLTATVRYDAQGAFGTGAAEYYLEPMTDEEWDTKAGYNSFWAGKGYLRVTNVDEDEATIEVLSDKNDVYRTVTLKEGETSNRIYYPGQYCTAAMKLKLNKIDNSEDMARVNIDGDTFWVRKGSKLLGGKCVVRDLNVFPGGSGSIEVSCSGSSRFTLVLGDSGVVLNNGTKDLNTNVGIGGSINVDKKKIYLGYYGKSDALKDKDKNPNGEFAILFKDSLSEDDVSDITGIFDVNVFNKSSEMTDALDRISKFKGKYEIVNENATGAKVVEGVTVVSVGFDSVSGGYGKETNIPKYLGEANGVVSSLVELFPAEKKQNDEYFGEEALYKQILLAGLAKDENMQIELIKKFLSTYPGSDSVEYMRDLKLNLESFDNTGSSANVFVNNNDYNIRVDGFASGSGSADSVTIRIGGGAAETLKRDRTYAILDDFKELNITEKDKVLPRLTVTDIDGTSAEFVYYWNNSKGKASHESGTIDKGSSLSLGDRVFSVSDTNVREVAYVSLVPEVRNTKTEANFTFNIGIEKRAIEISPEKAQKKVDALNKTIAEWESKIDKLGELVKGMKAACLATSTVLTLKSFIAGFSGGAAIARGKVMDVYEAKCRDDGYTDKNMHECFSIYNQRGDIERDVKAYGDALVAVNEDVKCADKGEGVKSGFLETKVVNSETYVEDLKKCTGVTESGDVPLDDARDIQAALLVKKACAGGDSVACNMSKAELDRVLADNKDRLVVARANEKAENDLGATFDFTRNTVGKVSSAKVVTKDLGGIKIGDKVSGVKYNGRDYYVVVGETGSAEGVYDSEGVVTNNIVGGESSVVTINKAYQFILPVDKEDSCSNPMKEMHVRYYESGNKQGFAAIVPVDKREGWYAQIENSDYDSSGVAKAFSICNVGKDGVMGEGAKSGDICQLFQISSAGSVSEFIPCRSMSSSKVKRLYQKAETTIRNANRNGNGVNLDGEFIHKTTPLGPSSTGMECTDFMSVSDCNLMFNVCDPVICPTSRCDLGGTFPVSDVIASGIIGSVVLCLPNFGSPAKGGVLIPVCLSGIHAGLDAYVSILRSHRDCLQENIDTGRYTGICDEITAIYTCEFFWGQFAPILDTLLVRFVEGMYGGFQTKGGAEYLTVQKSFDNLDKSIDYFSNNYMQNSFRAFNLKSTEEIGSTVCKGFVGSSVPTSGDMIDSFLEPESPSQFYAYFSEDLFSDATVPSTSHYKVYYHIYAGNDRGAQYRVYLKSPPESSYYSSRQTLLVDSGYAAKGVAADEAIDFTAPSGYKELCVSVNGQDECGFGSVTSDFGLNYASQAYVADQADDRQIDSTEDCVTTSTSAWAMASPNIQAGLEKSLGQDDIATSGIIRICASTNPDKGVVGGNDVYCNPSLNVKGSNNNSKCAYGYTCEAVAGDTTGVVSCKNAKTGHNQVSQGKWVDVGRCDGENMVCWLDTRSVKENLGQYMAVNNLTVGELVRESEDLKELDEQYKNVAEKIKTLRDDHDKLAGKKIGSLIDSEGELTAEVQVIIDGLDEVAGVKDNIGEGSNAAKAQALSIKASIYRLIVEKLIVKYKDVEGNGERPKGDECSDDNPCVVDFCVNGKCVMCRNDDDCMSTDIQKGFCDDDGECRLKDANEDEVICDNNKVYNLKWGSGKLYLKYEEGDVSGWQFSFDGEVFRDLPDGDIQITDNVMLSEFKILDLKDGCVKIEEVGLVE